MAEVALALKDRHSPDRAAGGRGRKYTYPIALKGALKLKEISSMHAEGCAAGEMKHGFIAMIDERLVIYTPASLDFLQPISVAVALQLFAYYVAVERGCDIDDQPRNLAKSVTVE